MEQHLSTPDINDGYSNNKHSDHSKHNKIDDYSNSNYQYLLVAGRGKKTWMPDQEVAQPSARQI